MTSAAERFLLDFHAAQPGVTTQAFAKVPVTCGDESFGSSYETLASLVPASASAMPISVLDLACGDGWLLSLLASRRQPGLALAGVDMSADELAHAARRLRGAATLHAARAQALPFDTGAFDVVLSHMALMLMDDAPDVLREIHRVLKPAGLLAAVVGSGLRPLPALALFIEQLTRRRTAGGIPALRFGDPGFRSEEGIRELLSPQFCDVRVDEIRFTLRLTPLELWDWFLRMYDVHQFAEEEREDFGREYQDAVAAHAGDDGRIELAQALRRVQARARRG